MTTASPLLRLGTRASPLAMAQTHLVRDALCAAYEWDEVAVQICPMTASGDKILDRSLADIGGKALWTKELDRALLDGAIDIAVHSMKDVETIRPEEISLVAVLPRADPRDRLIGASNIDTLSIGARVGTNSPRRAAQLLVLRPDLQIVLLRGNVATRLAKLEAGDADATLLAAAGLDRLGMGTIGVIIPVDVMLPAAAQGAIGIEARRDDSATCALLSPISDLITMRCVLAERAFLAALGAGCHSPVAAHAVVVGDAIHLRAELLLPDGTELISGEAMINAPEEASALATELLGRVSPALKALFNP